MLDGCEVHSYTIIPSFPIPVVQLLWAMLIVKKSVSMSSILHNCEDFITF